MSPDYLRTFALATLRAKYGDVATVRLLSPTTDLWVEATVNLARVKGQEQRVTVHQDGRIIER